MSRAQKPTNRKAAAVSIDRDLYERAVERSEALGLPTFSSYVVQLIRKDLMARGDLTLRESDGYSTDQPVSRLKAKKKA